MESTDPGRSSLTVPVNSPETIAEKIIWLYESGRGEEFGRNGRAYVEERYEINRCFERIEGLFREYLGA